MAHVLIPANPGDVGTRAAFAVGKSVGNSVQRHQVVRRLRPIVVAAMQDLPMGTQVVIRAMPEAAKATSQELQRDVGAAIAKALPTQVPEDSGADHESVHSHESALTPDVEGNAPDRGPLGQVLWIVGWPIRTVLLALIWIYRHTISPILPPTCRYYPSCSAYGFEALGRHGAAKGTVLAAWRVLRCNPFTPGGLDPVPERGHWRPGIHPDGTPREPSRVTA